MDAPYTALARRYRPQTFADVIGQQRIAQTLCRAITDHRVAHAYLFTGARGVGKTSMARIFAKALNCPQADAGVPCNQCETCASISSGQDVDVSEIDGASNRGIDDIRSLRANVHVRPMRSANKIYIIDEVHMLTKEAFNALLKTLEEPPPNVKFLFCTTEPNKLPDTILSRCQRFDFGTVATQNIILRLAQIAEAEGFQVDEEALELVARRAAGSMRDSQSLFDQLLAFGAEHIAVDDVHHLFGTAPDQRLVGLVDAVIARDRRGALELLDLALGEGVQLDSLSDQLICYVRDVVVTACGATELPLMGVGSHRRADVLRQAGVWGFETASHALQVLAECKQKMQRSTLGRPLFELALVRISLLADLQSVRTWIERLEGGGPLPPPVVHVSVAPNPTAAVSAPPRPISVEPTATPVQSSANRAEQTLHPPNSSHSSASQPPDPTTRTLEARSTTAARQQISQSDMGEDSGDSEPSAADLWEAAQFRGEGSDAHAPPVSENASRGRTAENQTAAQQSGAPTEPIPLLAGNEDRILDEAARRIPGLLATHLKRISQAAISGPNALELIFPGGYDLSQRYLLQPQVQSQIESVLQEVTGSPVRMLVRLDDSIAPNPVLIKPVVEELPPPPKGTIPEDLLVQDVTRILGVEGWRRIELIGRPAIQDDQIE